MNVKKEGFVRKYMNLWSHRDQAALDPLADDENEDNIDAQPIERPEDSAQPNLGETINSHIFVQKSFFTLLLKKNRKKLSDFSYFSSVFVQTLVIYYFSYDENEDNINFYI